MKNRYRNLFLLFGILAIVIMLCTMDMDYSDIWENVKRIGFWFPVIMLLWFFVYLINTCSGTTVNIASLSGRSVSCRSQVLP